ncbi:uncharacterized protein [Aegilops tauschii subsp. strangulata]|uniref:uncharacterized protein n=1 Tax=Aegilops tauschii subsp. strangulata TaxID=200361 RepID=UPI003CC8B1F4
MRGLNSGAKRSAIHSVISSDLPVIACLQETKLDIVIPPLVSKTLGPSFDAFFYLSMAGTCGGILLAWHTSELVISNLIIGANHITTSVSSLSVEHPFWLTGVYGPQAEADKMSFLQDLQDVRANCAGPWILGSDFNMIVAAAHKNNSRLNMRLIRRFCRFMADMELRDLYLHGRWYTWASEHENPTLVRIDRVLCTTTWESAFPSCLLRCLSSTASDHCPLVLDCTPRSPGVRRFHFEKFWPHMTGFM